MEGWIGQALAAWGKWETEFLPLSTWRIEAQLSQSTFGLLGAHRVDGELKFRRKAVAVRDLVEGYADFADVLF